MTQYVLEVTRWLDVGNFTNFFRDLANKLEHNKQVRKTIKELNKLTDKDLADIGICRGEIYSVATGAWKRDHYEFDTNKNLRGWV